MGGGRRSGWGNTCRALCSLRPTSGERAVPVGVASTRTTPPPGRPCAASPAALFPGTFSRLPRLSSEGVVKSVHAGWGGDRPSTPRVVPGGGVAAGRPPAWGTFCGKPRRSAAAAGPRRPVLAARGRCALRFGLTPWGAECGRGPELRSKTHSRFPWSLAALRTLPVSPPHVPLGPAVCVRGVSCAVGSAPMDRWTDGPMDRARGLERGRFRFRFLDVGTRSPDTGGRPVFFVVQGVARLCGSPGSCTCVRAYVRTCACVSVGRSRHSDGPLNDFSSFPQQGITYSLLTPRFYLICSFS